MGCSRERIRVWRPDGVILNRKMRPSNEAVWGGNFEDPKGPKRGIRALRLRTLNTLTDRHTQYFLVFCTTHSLVCVVQKTYIYALTCVKDTHTRERCQEEKLFFKNHNLGLHAHLLVCILILQRSPILFRLNPYSLSKKKI